MREPQQRQGRQCVRPEISRTKTFGETGSSGGQFFRHLQRIKLNDQLVRWQDKDLQAILHVVWWTPISPSPLVCTLLMQPVTLCSDCATMVFLNSHHTTEQCSPLMMPSCEIKLRRRLPWRTSMPASRKGSRNGCTETGSNYMLHCCSWMCRQTRRPWSPALPTRASFLYLGARTVSSSLFQMGLPPPDCTHTMTPLYRPDIESHTQTQALTDGLPSLHAGSGVV